MIEATGYTDADRCSMHTDCAIACDWCGAWEHEHPTKICGGIGLDPAHVRTDKEESVE